jgi:hypothetical protein
MLVSDKVNEEGSPSKAGAGITRNPVKLLFAILRGYLNP